MSTIRQQIETYVELKKHGFPIDEKESNEIKEYIQNTTLMIGDGSIDLNANLQELFPIEFSEAQNVINENM